MHEKKLRHLNLLLILGYGGLGAVIRGINLGSKPIWKDEWATLVFSLGHSFLEIPLDRIIDVSTILMPAVRDNAPAQDVFTHLMSESNHPALFFLINHSWLKLGSGMGELVNIFWARSLSVAFSCMAIVLSYGVGKWLFKSSKAGHFCGVVMALSPFGVYLAQETRHYTLTIIWIMASIAAYIAVVRGANSHQRISWKVIFGWSLANILGMATHYFFVLILGAQSLGLAGLAITQIRRRGWAVLTNRYWQKIYIAIVATVGGSSVWMPFLSRTQDQDLTGWLTQDPGWGWHLLEPIPRMVAWLITMVMILPVENVPNSVAILSGLIVIATAGVMTFKLKTIWQTQGSVESTTLMVLFWAVLLLMAAIVYGKGLDLTIAPRYSFVMLPIVAWLWGYGLFKLWDQSLPLHKARSPQPVSKLISQISSALLISQISSASHKQIPLPAREVNINSPLKLSRWGYRPLILLTLGLGLCGSLTVTMDGAYQKANRADLVADRIVNFAPDSSHNTAIATIHKTHSQTGEMMGIAWELVHRYPNFKPGFILAHKHQPNVSPALTIAELMRSRSDIKYLWVINFFDDQAPILENCERATTEKFQASGYSYYPYVCHQNK